jgi:hypothetical protein
MNPERQDDFSKDDPLWDLLDRASKPPTPSPYFARRVLREIDAPAVSRWGWFARFRLTEAWVPVAAAIALLITAGHFWIPQAPQTIGIEMVPYDDGQLPPDPNQRISVVLTDLDDLIAFEDNQMNDDDGTWQ